MSCIVKMYIYDKTSLLPKKTSISFLNGELTLFNKGI